MPAPSDPKLARLLSLYAASSLDKQLALLDLVGEGHQWDFDLQRGTLAFNDEHVFAAQVLGSESAVSGTWLWAWANAESGIPPGQVRAANQLKAFGAKHGIDAFTTPQIPLEVADGSTLAAIATGLSRADGMYRGPYDGGALLVTFSAPVLAARADASPRHLIDVFSRLIMQMPVDHRTAWRAFLEQKGYQVSDEDASIVGVANDGARVVAEFDRQGRVSGMRTTLRAQG